MLLSTKVQFSAGRQTLFLKTPVFTESGVTDVKGEVGLWASGRNFIRLSILLCFLIMEES